MIDEFIIEEAMEELKEKAENGKLDNDKANNFIIDYEWEDDYSHNDIGEMQEEFIKQAKEYLSENFKGQYMIFCDWCVHICTVDFVNKNFKDAFHGYKLC